VRSRKRYRTSIWSISRITLPRHRETELAKHHDRLARKRQNQDVARVERYTG
jgi:hypothetical protein